MEQAKRGLRTRVFISYSRKDDQFVKRLAASLDERGFAPDWDQSQRGANAREDDRRVHARWNGGLVP